MTDQSMQTARKGFTISIFARCLMILAVTTGIVAASISVLSTREAYQVARLGIQTLAADVTQLAASNIAGAVKFRKPDDIIAALSVNTERSEDKKLTDILVLDIEGRPLVELLESAGKNRTQLLALANAARETGEKAVTGDGFWVAEPVRDARGDIVGAIATIWTPEQFLNDIAAAHNKQLLIAFGLFLVMLGLAGWYLRHSLFKSLTGLTKRTRGLSDGDLESDIEGLGRSDEIGDTASALEQLRTKLKKAEASNLDALVQGAAFQASPIPMVILDPDFRITHSNRACTELAAANPAAFRHAIPGASCDEISGHMPDLTALGLGTGKSTDDLSAFPKSGGFEFQGQMFAASLNRISDDGSKTLGYVFDIQDVTNEQKAGALLKSLEADQMRADFDAEGNLTSANRVFAKPFSMGETLPTGQRFTDILTPITEGNLHAVLSDQRAYFGRLNVTINGTKRLVEGSLNPVEGIAGKPAGMIMIARDITEAQAALDKAEGEKIRLEENRRHVMDTLRKSMMALAHGNLRIRINENLPEDYEPLRLDFNSSVESLETTISLVDENATSILSEADNIARAADNLSQRTEKQASTLEQFAAALTEMTASVSSAAERADSAQEIVNKARSSAESSGEIVQQAVEAMGAIANSSAQISRIIGVIDEIAFQTNLLALNAGVEAARAGDAGRGFAVVASEVRALAQRSSEAASEINDLISSSGAEVERGVTLVGNAGDALKKIVTSVTDMTDHVSEIAASAREQATGLEEINGAMGQLDQVTQQNAAMFEETTAATHALNNEANALVETTKRFETSKSDQKEAVFRSSTARARATPPTKPAPLPLEGNLAVASDPEDDWEDF